MPKTDDPKPDYDHKDPKKSREVKFHEYSTALELFVTKTFGTLGSLAFETIDTNDSLWGLGDKFSDDDINVDEQADQNRWVKVQAAILYNLHHSFKDHDTIVIDQCARNVCKKIWRAKMPAELSYEDKRKLAWLPYGSICLTQLRSRYALKGLTDGLSKVTDFDQIRISFSPTSVQKWTENVETKWLDLKSLVEKHGPEYLAAMQLLMAISQCGNDQWTTWASAFMQKQEDNPFTVKDLLDRVQHESARLSAVGVGMPHQVFSAIASFCKTQGCKNPVSKPTHSWCANCFALKREAKPPPPQNVASDLAKKNKLRQKRKWARKKAKEKAAKEKADSEAHVAMMEVRAQPADADAGVLAAAAPVAASPPKKRKLSTPTDDLVDAEVAQQPRVKAKKSKTKLMGRAGVVLKKKKSPSAKKQTSTSKKHKKDNAQSFVSEITSYNPDTNGSFATMLPGDTFVGMASARGTMESFGSAFFE